jgi:hypothetical protein
MFDKKLIVILVAVVVVVGVLYMFSHKKVSSHEGFGMLPSQQWYIDRTVAKDQNAVAKGDFYSIPGTYQAILNPRFSNVQYGAQIRYNMPDYQNQAVPCEPLTFGNMAKEGYTRMGGVGSAKENFTTNATTEGYGCGSCAGGCAAVSCRKGGAPLSFHGGAPIMDSDYSAGNYGQMVDSAMQDTQYPTATDMIPVGDMTTVNALGETVQPIVYDRFIYANRSSRLRSQGDPIRGDLPIVPCAPEWFRPSVHPNIDLQTGAMNVLGGVDNETTRAMADLIISTSGDNNIAGVNMSSMRNMASGSALADVSVVAYP